jgi:hypothetical protein
MRTALEEHVPSKAKFEETLTIKVLAITGIPQTAHAILFEMPTSFYRGIKT